MMKIGKITSVNFNQFKVSIYPEVRGNSVNFEGTVYYFGNIGSYLKTSNALGENLVCEVVSIFDNDLELEKSAFDVTGRRELLLKPIGTIDRDKKFALGIGIFPSIYSDVNIITFDDMRLILQTVEHSENPQIHQSFLLGMSKNLINYPVEISIDKFFNIHSSVLGNSGSGKSNTIAHILQEIYKKQELPANGSRTLVFDVNGEYSEAFPQDFGNISIKHLKPNISSEIEGVKPFIMPHFLMNIDEWSAFLLATDATQRPFWDKVLQECYRFYMIASDDFQVRQKFVFYLKFKVCSFLFNILNQADSDTTNVTAASSVLSAIIAIIQGDERLSSVSEAFNLIHELQELQSACTINYGSNNQRLLDAVQRMYSTIDVSQAQTVLSYRFTSGVFFDYKFLRLAADITLLEEDARGNRRIREYTATMLTRLDYFLENPECQFMRDGAGIFTRDDYLKHIWGNSDGGGCYENQMVIVDTSELSPDALETLTGVVSRILFSERKELRNEERRKEPLHLVLDEAHRYIKKNAKYILKENIFETIAREGRKYSLYLLISSQRPSELSETVLSQCANFILHRIQNEVDMRYVSSILPYFSEDFTNKIKQSVPGEALIFGNCVSMPLHVKVEKANPQPDSENCKIPEEWFKDKSVTFI